MADWSKRKTRRLNSPWYAVLSVFVGVPFFLVALALLNKVWGGRCLPLGLSETANCKSSELIIVFAAVVGAVGMVIMVWWVFSDLTALRRIFEVPWAGVGDDVENAGVMESMLRAAMFIFVLWLCLAMLFPYSVSMIGLPTASIDGKDAEKRPNTSGGAPSTDPALVDQLKLTNSTLQSVKELLVQHGKYLNAISLNQKLLANPGTGTPSADPAIIKQMELVNSTLGGVKELLVEHGEHLSALRVGLKPPTPSTDPAVIEQLKLARSTLQSVEKLFTQHDQHLSALSTIQNKLDGWKPGQSPVPEGGMSKILEETARIDKNVEAINGQISEQSRRLAVLDRIYLVLLEKLRPQPVGECFDYVVTEAPGIQPATASPSSPQDVGRYRTTTAVRPVFFDRGSPDLSDWAKQDIEWFLRETNAPDSKLAIFGSTDPQGTEKQNAGLAKNRALAIQRFVVSQKTPHRIISVKSATEEGTPQSEPYKRVATIRLLEPCQK
jgi:outer membrane protein OmpA-like peptidoglycan-associated protein